jgi:hypothetical protein
MSKVKVHEGHDHTIGSSGINRWSTPVPSGPLSGPTARAPILIVGTLSIVHVIYPAERSRGFAKYSKPGYPDENMPEKERNSGQTEGMKSPS